MSENDTRDDDMCYTWSRTLLFTSVDPTSVAGTSDVT
jgi:hypothetical protein